MALVSSSSRVLNNSAKFRSHYNPTLGMANHGAMAKIIRLDILSFTSFLCHAKAPLPLRTRSASCGGKRESRLIVAASPPREDVIAPARPLTKEDLVQHLTSGCKPKDKWRIGTEHEKFGFEIDTLHRIKYDQIVELLNSIAERFCWDKITEGDKLIGLKQGKQSISLEPGGQLELSGAPVETLHQTYEEVKSHLYQVKAVAGEMGIGFLGIGLDPKWGLKDVPIIPKSLIPGAGLSFRTPSFYSYSGVSILPHTTKHLAQARFEIIRNYLPKVGSHGLDKMYRTCTVQVNLDFSSEADMIMKFRAALALQPIATALFANSPFTEGKPNGYLSMRSRAYMDTDNARTGMLPFVFDNTFGFERYVDYALDVPMVCVYRKKKYIECAGMSFRDFMAGKLPVVPGELPSLSDWENHLGTIWPEVRLKTFLEMRGADVGPGSTLCALPAFWVGLLYDEVSLQNVLDMIEDWTPQERQILRNQVPKTGLKTPFRDRYVRDLANDVVRFAKDGLERRGLDETRFLKPVADVVRTGVTPAERLLELYNGKWRQSVEPVFEELLY